MAAVYRAGSALLRAGRPALLGAQRLQSTVSYAQAIENVPETKLTTLDNGLRVATEESDHHSCTVGVWVDVGSRYENEKTNGVGNFLQHLILKGTKKLSQMALEQEVASRGAHLSAYTSREQTAYYMKCLSKDLPKAVELLGDLIQNSSLSEAEIESGRRLILQEMQEMESNLEEVVFDYLHTTAFQGTPLAYTVVGPSRNIKTLNRNDLVEFVTGHYKAPRIVLATSGGVQHDEVVGLARQHFGGISYKYEDDVVPVLSPCRFTGSQILVRDDAMPLAHIAIAVEGVGAGNPDVIPLSIGSMLVGSWDRTYGGGANHSSRLAKISVENKLGHSFRSFNTCYSDTGLWGIHLVCDGMNIEDMLHFAQGEWMTGSDTSVTESEVTRAKNHSSRPTWKHLWRQRDGTTPTCADIGRQILSHNRRISLAEWNARIDAVDARTLREVCSRYIYDQCPAVAAVGPIEQLPDYNRIRSAMYWLRL
ncbi:cytochrome b-c1 complex subunit 1, mitochondrial-like [Pristis pectinata]|uniref:cytochrome b-c1 complex subunit 1, mitochondrial-like n=1 Tax=Pristis pectinata TaxID=685728 RepID=UPI00223E58B4|nr:cytochrome b-c1 complex subunit 1, mitochondrial-like [Pristis pectinata]